MKTFLKENFDKKNLFFLLTICYKLLFIINITESLQQQHPRFVLSIIILNFDLENSKVKTLIDRIMLIIPPTKITLISKEMPKIERSLLGDKDIFVLSAVSDLETKFDLKIELANQLCERRQIREEITLEEFDETPLPDVPFVDDYVDPIVSYPVNLCTIQFNQTEGKNKTRR